MGSMKSLLGMLPGVGNQLKNIDLDDRQLNRTEAMIQSMTPQERKKPNLLDNSRRRRVAKGSGTSTNEISQLVKGFDMIGKVTQQMAGMGDMSKMQHAAQLASQASHPGMPGGMGGLPGFGKRKGTKQKGGGFKKRKKRR